MLQWQQALFWYYFTSNYACCIYSNIIGIIMMYFIFNFFVVWYPFLLSTAASPVFIVPFLSVTRLLDNKESNLQSVHWWRYIGLILMGKCGARATEQCNWRGSCSRSGSRPGAGRALLAHKRHGACDLGFSLPFSVFFIPLTAYFMFPFFTHISWLLPILLDFSPSLETFHEATCILFQQGIHNELFPHSYNPFKHAVRQSLVPACMSDIHPAT